MGLCLADGSSPLSINDNNRGNGVGKGWKSKGKKKKMPKQDTINHLLQCTPLHSASHQGEVKFRTNQAEVNFRTNFAHLRASSKIEISRCK